MGDTTLATKFEATAFTVGVERIRLHPYFDPDTYENDIAVLKLKTPVSLYDYPNIKPACLPDAGAKFPGPAIVSGWGTVAYANYSNSWLHEANVKVFEKGNCGYFNGFMTDDVLCAGNMQGGKDACHGDTGGPLIASDSTKHNAQTLIGVYSFGRQCGEHEDSPSIYAQVSHFISWLEQQMPDLTTCDPYDDSVLTTTTTATATATTTSLTTTTKSTTTTTAMSTTTTTTTTSTKTSTPTATCINSNSDK